MISDAIKIKLPIKVPLPEDEASVLLKMFRFFHFDVIF